ncbi:hypothetical protein QBC40DRAFT_260396 [Triangularia verruculosa]|uniref:Uncharacterized protein n=1 Tax=Triangularia verruculosa TaxID=2587418 RepID=A0AAN6X706_9PEZI|nr:hypothetical protein QBC40DRAFT_260396 [Triangularia verruculosa]
MAFYLTPVAISRTGLELQKPGAYVDIMKPFYDQAKATYNELVATRAKLEEAHKELEVFRERRHIGQEGPKRVNGLAQEELHWRQIWVLENNVEYLQGRLEDVTKRGEEKLAELEKSAANNSKDTYLKECRIWYLENILLYQQQKVDEAAKNAEVSHKGAVQSINQADRGSSASPKAPAREPDHLSNASKPPHGNQASVSSTSSFHNSINLKTNIDTYQEGPVFEEFAFADRPSYHAESTSTPRVSRLPVSEMDSNTEIFMPMRRVNKRVSFDGFTEYKEDNRAMYRVDHGQRAVPASETKHNDEVAHRVTHNSPDTILLFVVFAVIAGVYQVIRGD